MRYRLVGVEASHARGDDLWAFVTVQPDRTLRVKRVVHLTPAGQWYARGISLLAGLWILARVVRDWRVDRDAAGLVPRRRAVGAPDDGRDDGGGGGGA